MTGTSFEVGEPSLNSPVDAVNAEGSFGEWRYEVVHDVGAIPGVLDAVSSG